MLAIGKSAHYHVRRSFHTRLYQLNRK